MKGSDREGEDRAANQDLKDATRKSLREYVRDSFLCNKCRIKFEVGPKRGESTYCAAPNCGIRFWHVRPSVIEGTGGPAIVGMTPEDAASFKATGEIAA